MFISNGIGCSTYTREKVFNTQRGERMFNIQRERVFNIQKESVFNIQGRECSTSKRERVFNIQRESVFKNCSTSKRERVFNTQKWILIADTYVFESESR